MEASGVVRPDDPRRHLEVVHQHRDQFRIRENAHAVLRGPTHGFPNDVGAGHDQFDASSTASSLSFESGYSKGPPR